MVHQNKHKNTHPSAASNFETFLAHTSVFVMAAAVLISMAELAEREGQRVAATLQPQYAYAQQGSDNSQLHGGDDQLRRGGKEEIRHTSATYGEARRSHYISGSI